MASILITWVMVAPEGGRASELTLLAGMIPRRWGGYRNPSEAANAGTAVTFARGAHREQLEKFSTLPRPRWTQTLSAEPEALLERDEMSLIARVRAGDKPAFHELIRPYERAVYLAAYAVVHDAADAEETAQETMLKAFLNLSQLREDQKFKGWLLQIAVNEARMRRRKDHKHLYEPLDEAGESEEGDVMPRQFADWRDLPSDILENSEVRQAVAKALMTLPEKYRQVFLLRDTQQLNVEETARVLGISIPSVKTRLHRARLQLRETLTPIFRKRWTDRLPFRKGRNPW
jgi:RNA polymerase sigma-70 factor, ECF subfamily